MAEKELMSIEELLVLSGFRKDCKEIVDRLWLIDGKYYIMTEGECNYDNNRY